jgi:protein TonB
MNRIALRPVMPATASLMLHVALGAVVVVAQGLAPTPMPVLMAELVVAEPPALEPPPPPPKPIVRDRRPLTLPKPLATPLPFEAPAPARPEPEPPKAAIPEPPPVTPPEPAPPQPSASTLPVPSVAAPSGPAVHAAPGPPVATSSDPGPSAFAAPPPSTSPTSVTGTASSAARQPAVAALPDGVTQRAIPRGGYQYRPTYPATARRLGIQGTTLLQVLIGDTGRVLEVVVKQSAGHADLDQAAADAVRRWHFEPARRGNEAVEMWVQLPFEFKLQ